MCEHLTARLIIVFIGKYIHIYIGVGATYFNMNLKEVTKDSYEPNK